MYLIGHNCHFTETFLYPDVKMHYTGQNRPSNYFGSNISCDPFPFQIKKFESKYMSSNTSDWSIKYWMVFGLLHLCLKQVQM